MAESTLSRRISEFLGVALFALALIWLISLVTYEPTDPVWFFTPMRSTRRRTSSAASARSSPSCRSSCLATPRIWFPASIAWAGWHYFWCQPFEAIYTKLFGIMLLVGCSSAFLSLVFGSTDVVGQDVRRRRIARRMARGLVRRIPQSNRLDHRHPDVDGAVGHPLHAVFVRPDVRQRQPGLARSVGAQRRLRSRLARRPPQAEAAPRGDRQAHEEGGRPQAASSRPGTRRRSRREEAPDESPRAAGRAKKRADRHGSAAAAARAGAVEGAARAQGAFTLPPLSLLDPREGRAEDRRARADGLRAAARGEVPRVRRRRTGRADSSRARSSRRSSSSRKPA